MTVERAPAAVLAHDHDEGEQAQDDDQEELRRAKLEATDAIRGAATLIRIAPMVPATNEAIAAMTSAGPARPCFAMG